MDCISFTIYYSSSCFVVCNFEMIENKTIFIKLTFAKNFQKYKLILDEMYLVIVEHNSLWVPINRVTSFWTFVVEIMEIIIFEKGKLHIIILISALHKIKVYVYSLDIIFLHVTLRVSHSSRDFTSMITLFSR